MNEGYLKHGKVEKKQHDNTCISLWIDSYADIFSDFDPRPFSERAVSDDFVSQVKKVCRESKTKVSLLKILVPVGTQKDEYERMIRKRLENFFCSMYEQLKEETKATKVKGLYFSLSGMALMIIASYIAFLKLSGFYINLILVLFEPAGWFLLWSGLDHLISFSKAKRSELDFYNRMSNTHVEFNSYS